MKASQLISGLQDLIKEYGDREIEVNGEYNNFYPLTAYSHLEITSINLFADSENYQLMVDNLADLPV